MTNVIDTVYQADGTPAQGVLIITWPAFVTANGAEVVSGQLNATLGTNGALSVELAAQADSLIGMTRSHVQMMSEYYPRLGAEPQLLNPSGEDVAGDIFAW